MLGKRCEWALKNSHRTGIDKVRSKPIRRGTAGKLALSPLPPKKPHWHQMAFYFLASKYYFRTINEYYTPAETSKKKKKALPRAWNDGQESVSCCAELRWKEEPLRITNNGHVFLVPSESFCANTILTAGAYIKTPQIGRTASVKT